ncbi:MAG TPA: calcium/sodium antiporter [Acidimicrobiia bacterium]|nr:calcium/sodium antiporter [Acidimicrobiia bacterium]
MDLSLTAVLQVLAGLVLLTFAADRLVLAAARLSRLWGLSPILIGAVVVGLGTSLPEMLVSGLAAAEPDGLDLALGNIVGSNVANVALVLGLSVVLSPIVGQGKILMREGGLMLVGMMLLTFFAWDGGLSRSEGIILGVGLLVALGMLVIWSRREGAAIDLDEIGDRADIDPRKEILFGTGSLAVTLLGAQLLVRGAEEVALGLGVSEALIGLTLVAVGTSLPELATALAAARRNENDLVLGNVLGSNLFNALGVGAVAGIIGNGTFTADFNPSMVAMLAIAVLAGILAIIGNRLDRWQGAVLLACYPVVLFLI